MNTVVSPVYYVTMRIVKLNRKDNPPSIAAELKIYRKGIAGSVIRGFGQLGIAFFEYCFQVPANRLGSEHYTLPQLKIIQEVITMVVFAVFSILYMKQQLTMNYVWASFCLLGAVYFIFRS